MGKHDRVHNVIQFTPGNWRLVWVISLNVYGRTVESIELALAFRDAFAFVTTGDSGNKCDTANRK